LPGPSPTTTDPPDDEICADLLPDGVMEAQRPLVVGAEAVVDASDLVGGAGFAGVTLEVEECKIHVYWDGPLPPIVAAVVEDLRESMQVDVHTEDRYTHAELSAVAAELIHSSYRGNQAGVNVTEVSVRPEGTLVDVKVWPLPAVPPVDPALAAARAQQLWQSAGLPVLVGAEPPAPLTSRWIDQSPWIAGALHDSAGYGAVCSTGWPLGRESNTPPEPRYLLVAAHCATAAYGTPVGKDARVIGRIWGRTQALDAALVEVTRPDRVSPATWDGSVHDLVAPFGVNDDHEFFKEIADWSKTFAGQRLCTSGALTGVHCDIRVLLPDVSYKNEIGWTVTGSATARQDDGLVAIGAGDSGGPVFSLTDGDSRVIAVGMIAAGRAGFTVDCAGHPTTDCYKRFRYTRLEAIRANWNVKNVTRTGLK
jgi:hypothetical protein